MNESKNNVVVRGLLIENNLANKVTKNGEDMIAGSMVVETAPDNLVPVHFISKALTKAGAPNKVYEKLQKYMEYPAAVVVGRENASYVAVTSAMIRGNDFIAPDGRLVSTTKITSNFANALSKAPEEMEATFTVEVYIQKIVDEVIKEDATGNIVIKGLAVGYNDMLTPIDFVVENPQAIAYINKNYEQGQTVKLHGNILYKTEERKEVTEQAFGDPVEKTFTNTVRKYIVTSGSEPYDEDAGFSMREIKPALAARAEYLEGMKEKADATPAPSANNASDTDF